MREGARILAEREGVIVADKPPGIPTLLEPGFETSLVDEIAGALGIKAEQLHALNRLDVGVSGTVVLRARGQGSSRERDPAFERRYLGLTSAPPAPASGCWAVPIGRGPRGTWAAHGKAARPALTRYATVAQAPAPLRVPGGAAVAAALVSFELGTGRTHQIRIHAAAAKAPLIGDPRYGGPRRFVSDRGSVREFHRIALHAARVAIELRSGVLRVESETPADLRELWAAFGGDAVSFDQALAIPVPACE